MPRTKKQTTKIRSKPLASAVPGPYKAVQRVEVWIWGRRAGAVALDPGLGFYVFAYDPAFGRTGIELAPLHMPVDTKERPYFFNGLPEQTYKRLPAMLADALPDDFGNALVNAYMAAKGIPAEQITPLDRLAYMGKRAMGALEFRPARGPRTTKPTVLAMDELVTEARAAVRGSVEHDDQAHATLRNIIEVGTSAGGARAKAVIAWNPSTGEIRSGQLDAPKGFEHWLLKFDGMGVDRELGVSQAYGRIEFAYYLMATAAGINMSESRLLQENGRAHFMTKRFDRDQDGTKVHVQTLCAMSHLDYKKRGANAYEQLFLTCRDPRLRLGHETDVEIFRRMVFNVAGRNCDDHTKNVAFVLRQGERGSWPRLMTSRLRTIRTANGRTST